MTMNAYAEALDDMAMSLSKRPHEARFGRPKRRLTAMSSVLVLSIGMAMMPMTSNATTSWDCQQGLKDMLEGTLEVASETDSRQNGQESSNSCMIANLQDRAMSVAG